MIYVDNVWCEGVSVFKVQKTPFQSPLDMELIEKFVFSCFCIWVFLSGLTDAGQESFKVLHLRESDTPVFQSLSGKNLPIAVLVDVADLLTVSSNILMAENWLKTHVLAHFPSTKISTIIVGRNIICNRDHVKEYNLVLPSLKNIYRSLVRWSLETEIKVSPVFSVDCMDSSSSSFRFRNDLGESLVKPLLNFLANCNSTYSVILQHFSHHETTNFISGLESLRQSLGDYNVDGVNILVPEISKTERRRELSIVIPELSPPSMPLPSSELNQPKFSYSFGFSKPKNPIQSSNHPASPPESPISFVPDGPSSEIPGNSPEILPFPPCSAMEPLPPSPEIGLWCVAKPTVPSETLQEAMDYACGEGGADCDEIRPNGNCYNPDSLVAHASYAFNSYWQKTKINGGSCNFGGTAMIINSDPSYLQCQFTLS